MARTIVGMSWVSCHHCGCVDCSMACSFAWTSIMLRPPSTEVEGPHGILGTFFATDRRHRRLARPRGLPNLPAPGPDLVRRAYRAPGLFPRGIRRAQALAGRCALCAAAGDLPVPARSGEQPDGIRD